MDGSNGDGVNEEDRGADERFDDDENCIETEERLLIADDENGDEDTDTDDGDADDSDDDELEFELETSD